MRRAAANLAAPKGALPAQRQETLGCDPASKYGVDLCAPELLLFVELRSHGDHVEPISFYDFFRLAAHRADYRENRTPSRTGRHTVLAGNERKASRLQTAGPTVYLIAKVGPSRTSADRAGCESMRPERKC
jgi:hypothetical protein